MPADEISNADIGERLRIEREANGLTQAAAASAINVARTTLVAIEKGERKVRHEEIQKLARLYNTSINTLLRREAIFVDLLPRFRKLSEGEDKGADEAAQLLTELVRAEVELENILGINRPRSYPPERPILPGNVRSQAESDALELRSWLGLGTAPVRDVITLLEMDMGVRVYVRPLPSHISGLFAYDETFGACILLNASHPKERRAQTAAHELGHFISARRIPDVLHEDFLDSSREEKYADAFGRAFLTPARVLMQKFHEITAGSHNLTRRHVILLAHTFGVSREAIVRRLEELGLVHKDTWAWFESNGGITSDQAQQVLGDITNTDLIARRAKHPASIRLNLLATEAWRQGLLSESQLARLLHLGRIDLRRVLDSVEAEGIEGNELPKFLK